MDEVQSLLSFKRYARKIISRGYDNDHNRIEQRDFIKELQQLKTLQHDHLVRIVGSYTDNSFIAYIMLPVAEGTLEQFLRREDPLLDQEANALRQFYGCLSGAVHFLHSHKIRHRDLTCRNVLIHKGNVFISDFGSSHDFSSRLTSSTRHRQTAVSRDYMAPEFSRPAEERGTPSDMWSLGVIFLEMTTRLRGRTLRSLKEAILGHSRPKALPPYLYCNIPVINTWLKALRERDHQSLDQYDNETIEWVSRLLVESPKRRLTARLLMKDILESPSFHKFCCAKCENRFRESGFEDDELNTQTREGGVQELLDTVSAVFQSPDQATEKRETTLKSSIEQWRGTFDGSPTPSLLTPGTTRMGSESELVTNSTTQQPTYRDSPSVPLNMWFRPVINSQDNDSSSTPEALRLAKAYSARTFESSMPGDWPSEEDQNTSSRNDDPTTGTLRLGHPTWDKYDEGGDSESLDGGRLFDEISSGDDTDSISAFTEVESNDDDSTSGRGTYLSPGSRHVDRPNISDDNAMFDEASSGEEEEDEDFYDCASDTHSSTNDDERLRKTAQGREDAIRFLETLPEVDEDEMETSTGALVVLPQGPITKKATSDTKQDAQKLQIGENSLVYPQITLNPSFRFFDFIAPPQLKAKEDGEKYASSALQVLDKPEDVSSPPKITNFELIPPQLPTAEIDKDESPPLIPEPPDHPPNEDDRISAGSGNEMEDEILITRASFGRPRDEDEAPKQNIATDIAIPLALSKPDSLPPEVSPEQNETKQPESNNNNYKDSESPKSSINNQKVPKVTVEDVEDVEPEPKPKPKPEPQPQPQSQPQKGPPPTRLTGANLKALNKSKKDQDILTNDMKLKAFMRESWESASSQPTSVIPVSTKAKLGNFLFPRGESIRMFTEYCKEGKPSVVKYLFAQGCKLGPTKKQAPGPILAAARGGTDKHFKCARILIDNGANVNVKRRSSGKTPLHYAIEHEHYKKYESLVWLLLNAGAKPNVADTNEEYPITKLFTGQDSSPLKQHHLHALAILLDKGAKPNVVLPATGNTPLHLATRRQDPLAVGMLIYKGADVTAVNSAGITPLHMSASQLRGELSPNHETVLKLLLKAGSGVSTKGQWLVKLIDFQGGAMKQTALHHAVKSKAMAAVDILLDYSANPDVKDSEGVTARDLVKKHQGKETNEEHRRIWQRLLNCPLSEE